MAVNKHLSISTNLGRSLISSSDSSSIGGMLRAFRDKELEIDRVVYKVGKDSHECAFCFKDKEGSNHFYPFKFDSSKKRNVVTSLSVAGRSVGINIDGLTAASLSSGQYHFTKDGIKRTVGESCVTCPSCFSSYKSESTSGNYKCSCCETLFLSVGGYSVLIDKDDDEDDFDNLEDLINNPDPSIGDDSIFPTQHQEDSTPSIADPRCSYNIPMEMLRRARDSIKNSR